jgi:hypothetical protein
MTARAATVRAVRALAENPPAIAAALLGGAAAALGGRASAAAASRLWGTGWPGRAVLAFACGALAAGLFGGFSLAAALASAGGLRGRELLRASVGRGVAILSLEAVEQVVQIALLLAAAAPAAWVAFGAAPSHPVPAAAACAFAAAGPLLLGLCAFAAFRVAIAAAGRGAPSHEALARGLHLALAHLPSLLRLFALCALAAAPLWIGALLLPEGGARAAQVAVAAVRGALALGAAAWLYAAVGEWADARSAA